MIKRLKHIFLENKVFYVLGITLSDVSEKYHLLEVLFKEDDITILNRQNFSVLNADTIAYLKKDYPVIINVDGNSVISKAVENTVGYINNLIFKSNPDDFYFYEYHQDEKVFASLSRKETITSILNTINDCDKYVVHITLGPFVLVNLFALLKHEETLVSSNYQLQVKDKAITNYQKKEAGNINYHVGDDVISENDTTLLASLIDYLYPNQNIKANIDYLNFNREQFKYKKRFKFYGVAVLVTILGALFISHFILLNKTKELAEKESLVSISNQTLVQLNNLKEERSLKEKILLTSSVTDKNYTVKYINDIGESVPSSISLDVVSVKKPAKKIKPNEKVGFDINIIEIIGYSTDDNAFNDWYKSLKHMDWVKQSEIVKYREDSKSKNSFLIHITL